MCCIREAFFPRVFIICVSLITSTRCDSFSNAIEGESVELEFPYPCNSTQITLQNGNRLPFYDSANQELIELDPDQSERFTVEEKTDKDEDHCFLQLCIDTVKRLDGGTYILLTRNGDYITRIGLHVDFLPGVAHCSFGGDHDYAGDWEKLQCRATVGSMLGQIQCYQLGMSMPHLSEPSENDKTLKQTILLRHNRHQVYCCSSQLIEPKGRCDCNDFVWDTLSGSKVHNPGDPCPTTTHVPTAPLITTSYHHDHTSSTVRAITPNNNEVREDSYLIMLPWHILIVVFVMSMIVFFAYLMYLARSKLLRHRGNSGKETSLIKTYLAPSKLSRRKGNNGKEKLFVTEV